MLAAAYFRHKSRKYVCVRRLPRRMSHQKFPKRTRILSIQSKLYTFHSVHSAIGSRMNGMIFQKFRKRNSSQKNTNTVYSEDSYSGIVPKDRAPKLITFARVIPRLTPSTCSCDWFERSITLISPDF